jgi:hypothetical protein
MIAPHKCFLITYLLIAQFVEDCKFARNKKKSVMRFAFTRAGVLPLHFHTMNIRMCQISTHSYTRDATKVNGHRFKILKEAFS